jgi:hypothetical protein
MTCLLLGGCNAVVSFGGFKFGSGDAGIPDAAGEDADVVPEDAGGLRDSGPLPKSDAGMTCSAKPESACGDRIDNDCDNLEDCADPDCSNDMHCCKPSEIPEVSCSGGIDDDCDGLVDCKDPNCSASKDCCSASSAEVGNTACGDGVDNDCDGVVDCQEAACAAQSVCCKATGSERDDQTCSDGVDNDCDGKLDCSDPDCAVVSACCTKDSVEPTETTATSCVDGKDNDCDGLADCRDSDCDSVDVCKLCMPTSKRETSCVDKIDNDCDKDRDCMDPDCAGDPACCVPMGAENNSVTCVDGKDNDCDGHVDCADPECAGTLDCCVSSGPESGDAACSDDKDNDCNGLLNCQDPSCAGVATCCVRTGPETGVTACNDRVDNDCDTKTDCADSDCLGIGASCCVPTGSESSQPNDGKDNDCDGLVDIPILNAAYPTQGLPSSGREVALTFAPSIVAGAMLECSTRRATPMSPPRFDPCPGTGSTVNPHSDAASADAANDGVWLTDVRWRFPDGAHSQGFQFKYYIHHTLHKAKRCTTPISDAQWFAKAQERLANPKSGIFRPGEPSDTFLTNPFVRVTYSPPNANDIFYAFQQDGSPHTIEMWSLRRKFALSADNRFLLIVRNYTANRSSQCFAAHFRVHNAHRKYNNNVVGFSCEAVVLNRSGAGVCLKNVNGVPDFARDWNDDYAGKLGWPAANKFMWRQLVEQRGRDGGDLHRDAYEDGRRYVNFTPKCAAQPCANPNGIYLPDRALFP